MVDPSKVKWYYNHIIGKNYYKTSDSVSSPSFNELHIQRYYFAPKEWWAKDIDELKIDLYWRVMLAIKTACKVFSLLIGEAL